MTPEIAFTLGVLVVATALFISERSSADVVALLVMLSLTISGVLTPVETLAGFSNPAVVTVWAMFVLSGALARSGVAGIVGRQVLRAAGGTERRLTSVMMLSAAGLSGFMNNGGVTALMMPVVMDLSRRVRLAPSRLLMPLAYATLLGGSLTLLGTPPNLLVNDVLQASGFEPFGLFSFTPTGVAVVIVGVAYMALVGRLLLPRRDVAQPGDYGPDVGQYDLEERQFVVRLETGSALAGRSLANSRLGAALDLNVVALLRDGETLLAPAPETNLRAEERLVVEGRRDRLELLRSHRHFQVIADEAVSQRLAATQVTLLELHPSRQLIGRTIRQSQFRQSFGLQVLAMRQGDDVRLSDYEDVPIERTTIFLAAGPPDAARSCTDSPAFDSARDVAVADAAETYGLDSRLLALGVMDDSPLVGRTLIESYLGSAFGLGVVGIARAGDTEMVPAPDTVLCAGDVLFVKAAPETLRSLRALQGLEIETGAAPTGSELESEDVGLAEVVLSPYSRLAGQTLGEMHFREKYGLNVVAVWRGGTAHRTGLRDMRVRFGDALLLHGRRDRLHVLAASSDFLVLTQSAQEAPRRDKAPVAVAILALCVIVPVTLGWLTAAIASVLGATMMVVTRCLRMDEAHKFIEWRAVFMIAGMLPLGAALQKSGAAQLIADGVVSSVGGFGPYAVLAAVFVLTSVSAQVMPSAAAAVLVAPIAIQTATALSLSPHTFAMMVAVASSTGFMSPVSNPANIIVMGPGGYRFADYTKVGFLLVLSLFVTALIVVPLFWPITN